MQVFYDRQGSPITVAEADRLLSDFSYVTVARHWVRGWMVSTVWNGCDVGRYLEQASSLFETMIFAPDAGQAGLHGELDHWCMRYPAEAAALAGHDQALAMVRDELGASADEIMTTAPDGTALSGLDHL